MWEQTQRKGKGRRIIEIIIKIGLAHDVVEI